MLYLGEQKMAKRGDKKKAVHTMPTRRDRKTEKKEETVGCAQYLGILAVDPPRPVKQQLSEELSHMPSLTHRHSELAMVYKRESRQRE